MPLCGKDDNHHTCMCMFIRYRNRQVLDEVFSLAGSSLDSAIYNVHNDVLVQHDYRRVTLRNNVKVAVTAQRWVSQ